MNNLTIDPQSIQSYPEEDFQKALLSCVKSPVQEMDSEKMYIMADFG